MEQRKRELIRFMHAAGFKWVGDVTVDEANKEAVKRKKQGWIPLEVIPDFERLFKGSIRYTMRK